MANDLPDRRALGKKLRSELDKASLEFKDAIRFMQRIAQDTPSGLPSPDGLQRLHQANTMREQAFRNYQKALRELEEFTAAEAGKRRR